MLLVRNRQISIREVSQHLSKYIAELTSDNTITITKRGVPIAQLSAMQNEKQLSPAQVEARKRSKKRLQQGYDLSELSFNRDAIYTT